MSRTRDQLNRLEASVKHLEEALAGHAAHLREQVAAVRIETGGARSEAQAARSSAESAHAGVQALADMLPVPAPVDPVTGGPTAVRRAAKAPKGQA
jgi:hypothetical protein